MRDMHPAVAQGRRAPCRLLLVICSDLAALAVSLCVFAQWPSCCRRGYDELAGTNVMDDEAVGYFLELRLRMRGNPEGRAVVDRCLSLIARAADADADALVALEREVQALADELALRFGAPKTLQPH